MDVQFDYAVVTAKNEDLHLLRLGDRVTEEETRGHCWHFAVGLSFLFNDTIMANIRYAVPGVSDDAVMEASRRAYADDFIAKLPHGYMTVIGEGGTQLSQGEKRRLMIARAILKNPQILILDEPLVSLDADTRRGAIDGLSSLMLNSGDKTAQGASLRLAIDNLDLIALTTQRRREIRYEGREKYVRGVTVVPPANILRRAVRPCRIPVHVHSRGTGEIQYRYLHMLHIFLSYATLHVSSGQRLPDGPQIPSQIADTVSVGNVQ